MGPRSRCRHGNEQSGATLIEVLVTIVVTGIIVTGVTMGIITLIRTTSQANDAARANVLIEGYADIVKEVPYVRCDEIPEPGRGAELATRYHDSFLEAEDDLSIERQLLRNTTDSVVATDVQVNCDPADHGAQTITYEVTSRSVTREAQVTKLDPDFDGGLFAELHVDPVSGPGDSVVLVGLDGAGSTPRTRIVTYVFRCDRDDPADPEIIVDEPNHEDAVCEWPAPAADEVRWAGLRVIDQFGQSTEFTWAPVTLHATTSPRDAPALQYTARCLDPDQDATIAGTPCVADPSRTVAFDVSGTTMPEGRIVSYEWDFGDPDSRDANYLKSGEPTATHTYSRSGAGADKRFTASVTLYDELGARYTGYWEGEEFIPYSIPVHIERPGPPPPVAAFTFAPNPAIARQTMTFDAADSIGVNPDGSSGTNADIVSYVWDFGDPPSGTQNTSIAMRPNHLYVNPGTYTVTLTVTDNNGLSSTTSTSVVIGSLQGPNDPSINLRLTHVQGCLFGFQWFGCRALADFTWRNGQSSGGDQLNYEIEWRYVSGYCFAFSRESRVVAAGAAGTVQTFRYNFRGASDFCQTGTYEWRARTHRHSIANGSFWSDWTPWQRVTVPW